MLTRPCLLTVIIVLFFCSALPLSFNSGAQAPAPQTRDRSQYVGFFNQRELTWRPFEAKGFPPGVEVKLLSRDSKTGAVSLLARFPAGWRLPQGYHSSDAELFVLQGALRIGQQKFTERCYTYAPAGARHSAITVEQTTTALWFFEGEPDFISAQKSQPDAQSDQAVALKNYFKEAWIPAVEIGFSAAPGIFMKILKRLPNDGPMTWISGSFAGRPPRKYEVHPSFEEAYCLEGEFNLAECLPGGIKVGHLTEGSYFFRPPDIRHIGPYSGSRSYVLWFFRTPKKLASTYFDDCP
jgi:quercetin dioxygenase-like cupin family protein